MVALGIIGAVSANLCPEQPSISSNKGGICTDRRDHITGDYTAVTYIPELKCKNGFYVSDGGQNYCVSKYGCLAAVHGNDVPSWTVYGACGPPPQPCYEQKTFTRNKRKCILRPDYSKTPTKYTSSMRNNNYIKSCKNGFELGDHCVTAAACKEYVGDNNVVVISGRYIQKGHDIHVKDEWKMKC